MSSYLDPRQAWANSPRVCIDHLLHTAQPPLGDVQTRFHGSKDVWLLTNPRLPEQSFGVVQIVNRVLDQDKRRAAGLEAHETVRPLTR